MQSRTQWPVIPKPWFALFCKMNGIIRFTITYTMFLLVVALNWCIFHSLLLFMKPSSMSYHFSLEIHLTRHTSDIITVSYLIREKNSASGIQGNPNLKTFFRSWCISEDNPISCQNTSHWQILYPDFKSAYCNMYLPSPLKYYEINKHEIG